MALAGAGPAFAGTLPSCATGVNCTNNGPTPAGGTAGYYGANDNHTHYKFVNTVTVATAQLVNLNGVNNNGSTGVTLCDPNTGQVAQLSLGFNNAHGTLPAGFHVAWAIGKYMNNASEPCVQNANKFLNPFRTGNLLQFTGISGGDKINLSISYNPSSPSLSFNACDITSGVCRQALKSSPTRNFWEAGIGAFTAKQGLTAPANNPLDANSSNTVQCYSCAAAVPITSISPVNPFNIGGLFETQLVNVSTQVTMSPNDSLSASTDDFGIWNGSTSP
jgi:hypothetical protein